MASVLLAPITETSRGLHAYVRGLQWLKAHPRYLVMLFVPLVLGFVFFVGSFSFYLSYADTVMGWVYLTEPEAWYWLPFYYLGVLLMHLAMLVVTGLAAFLAMNIFAAPLYELVSVAVEKDVLGLPPVELNLWENVKAIVEEAKKALLILMISIVLLFIPVVNALAVVIAAFLLGWDFYDFPLARRGWPLGDRVTFVTRNFWSVMGFGLWLVIPFVNVVLIPLAVAGGTILNVEALRDQGLLSQALTKEDKHA